MDDRHELQENINSLESWASLNQLTLNPKKTYHVSYGKKVIDTLYFLKGNIIEKTPQVRDLGLIFDDKLTFKTHIESITRRLNQMTGAARRFCNDIKSPITMSKIFKIYMQPVIDYGSLIWNQNRIGINTQITLAVKRATRYALNISHFTSPSHYICFEMRCDILDIDLPDTRRRTQAAIFGLKLLKEESRSPIKEVIMPFLINQTEPSRRQTIFSPFYNYREKVRYTL